MANTVYCENSPVRNYYGNDCKTVSFYNMASIFIIIFKQNMLNSLVLESSLNTSFVISVLNLLNPDTDVIRSAFVLDHLDLTAFGQ